MILIGILSGLLGFLQGVAIGCLMIWCVVFTAFWILYLARNIRAVRRMHIWIKRRRPMFTFDDGTRHRVIVKTVTVSENKKNNEKCSNNNDSARLSRLR